jgi:cytochrome c553
LRPAIALALACAGSWQPVAAMAGDLGDAAWVRSAGEALYRRGVLADGSALRGEREAGVVQSGQAAACVNCHRQSGLGSIEGNTVIPPIIGQYLFRSQQDTAQDLAAPHVEGYQSNRPPYTDGTLARAIVKGESSNGRPLSYLMPRYALDAGSMALLAAYLRQLTSGPVPGVSDQQLQFATIITPDADPVARDGMLAVLRRYFDTQNRVIADEVRPMKTSRSIMYRVTRKWQLHEWQLHGPPEEWERQLDAYLSAEPVFAVISGIGGADWSPVHRFCQRQQLPCLMPNVDLPVVAEGDFYPVYFSRGVLLEADLVAATLQPGSGGRVLQVYRSGDVGEAAAQALAGKLAGRGLELQARVLPAGGAAAGAALRQSIGGMHSGDRVVLWLRPGDLQGLPDVLPRGVEAYVSGRMGGLEQAPLPAAWRAYTHVTYPFDLPGSRKVRMNVPFGWMKIQGIPITNEQVQADTYLACTILAEALGHMLDSFVRDFLVERLELMLSRRLVNGYYPHLGLAAGQRFASKGGYLVQVVGQGGPVVAEGDWRVP